MYFFNIILIARILVFRVLQMLSTSAPLPWLSSEAFVREEDAHVPPPYLWSLTIYYLVAVLTMRLGFSNHNHGTDCLSSESLGFILSGRLIFPARPESLPAPPLSLPCETDAIPICTYVPCAALLSTGSWEPLGMACGLGLGKNAEPDSHGWSWPQVPCWWLGM